MRRPNASLKVTTVPRFLRQTVDTFETRGPNASPKVTTVRFATTTPPIPELSNLGLIGVRPLDHQPSQEWILSHTKSHEPPHGCTKRRSETSMLKPMYPSDPAPHQSVSRPAARSFLENQAPKLLTLHPNSMMTLNPKPQVLKVLIAPPKSGFWG